MPADVQAIPKGYVPLGESCTPEPTGAKKAIEKWICTGNSPPGAGHTEEEWHHYRGQRLLPRLPGDDGHVAWVAAQYTFVEGIRTASISCYGDESTVEGAARLRELKNTFPLVSEEI